MIGSGKAHVAHAQNLAEAMVRDGIPQEAVSAFASLGSFGAHPSNAERDLHRWLQGIYGVSLEPYFIDLMLETEDVDEEAGKPLTASRRIPVLLPHEIFAELHSASAHQVPTGHKGHTWSINQKDMEEQQRERTRRNFCNVSSFVFTDVSFCAGGLGVSNMIPCSLCSLVRACWDIRRRLRSKNFGSICKGLRRWRSRIIRLWRAVISPCLCRSLFTLMVQKCTGMLSTTYGLFPVHSLLCWMWIAFKLNSCVVSFLTLRWKPRRHVGDFVSTSCNVS